MTLAERVADRPAERFGSEDHSPDPWLTRDQAPPTSPATRSGSATSCTRVASVLLGTAAGCSSVASGSAPTCSGATTQRRP